MLRIVLSLLVCFTIAPVALSGEPAKPFVIVVMDPLSKELACPCVKGYAQRDYVQLGKYLEKRLNRPVTVEFGESLAATMAKKTNGKADLIIGKESVVRHEASKLKYPVEPVVSLIGLDGKTTMTGLIVVAAKDPALTAADLKDHTLYFGFDDADEKFLMPMNLLKDLGVPLPKNPETCASCSVGATKVVDDAKAGKMAAAMISSYAQPLLEGCGTVQKGDLRVIGETDPVPFIVGFLSSGLTAEEKTAVTQGLVAMKDNADLCKVLESKGGFVLWQAKKK